MFVMFPEWKACGGFVPCIWRNPINPTLTSVESRPRPTLHTVFSKTHSQIWTLSHRRELTFQLGAKLKKQILKIVAPAVFSQMVGPFDVYRFAREREREKDQKKRCVFEIDELTSGSFVQNAARSLAGCETTWPRENRADWLCRCEWRHFVSNILCLPIFPQHEERERKFFYIFFSFHPSPPFFPPF